MNDQNFPLKRFAYSKIKSETLHLRSYPKGFPPADENEFGVAGAEYLLSGC